MSLPCPEATTYKQAIALDDAVIQIAYMSVECYPWRKHDPSYITKKWQFIALDYQQRIIVKYMTYLLSE